MRVSDYVIQFLKDEYKIDTFFTVSGGGCIFLIDSLGKADNIKLIANHHEQACAIAAEGYARMHNKLGACVVTSGPGGTNAMTGVLCSWLDSIPMIVISGQVNTNMTTHYTKSNLRQLGDQEFNIVETVKNMTKLAVQVNDPKSIRFFLEGACRLATTGRPGPVWIDIPLDVQSAEIDPQELYHNSMELSVPIASRENIFDVHAKLNKATKPLLIVGNGIRLGNALPELKEFLDKTNIPVISSVNGNDIVNADYEQYCGRFGTHAQIGANKLLKECDLLLTIGTRLYVRQTGYNFAEFAKQAYRIYVDVDKEELNKPTLFPNMKIESDAKEFLQLLNENPLPMCSDEWKAQAKEIASAPRVLPRHREQKSCISHYAFIECLSKNLPKDHHIVTSNGSANVVTMQVMDLHGEQRLITNTGCAPMGYGLPAAIGASANGDKIICIDGDGSLHFNIHELQTMKHHNLPIKLIILNNNGYLSIKVSQKAFFKGFEVVSGEDSGLSLPDYKKLVKAYQLPYMRICHPEMMEFKLKEFLQEDGPSVLEVYVDPLEVHEPKVMATLDANGKFVPGALENIKWSDE